MFSGTFFIRQKYSSYYNKFNDDSFGLSSSSDAVRLFDSNYVLQDEVYYDSVSPWPVLANGQGYTLELIEPNLDNSLPHNWSNINYNGSPDAVNSATASLNDDEFVFSFII